MAYSSSLLIVVQRAVALLISCCIQHGCHSRQDKNDILVNQGDAPAAKPINLTLHGYNYTDRYIDDYSVNGTSGGNLSVSGPGSVGGGSICCMTYFRGAVQKVKVRWQADACSYIEKSKISLEEIESIHSIYKEVEVDVSLIAGRAPRYFEVHFYPDGHVEAAITDVESRSRLRLEQNRENNSKFPRCPHDQQPRH